jgi:hypothetical protein
VVVFCVGCQTEEGFPGWNPVYLICHFKITGIIFNFLHHNWIWLLSHTLAAKVIFAKAGLSATSMLERSNIITGQLMAVIWPVIYFLFLGFRRMLPSFEPKCLVL